MDEEDKENLGQRFCDKKSKVLLERQGDTGGEILEEGFVRLEN